MRNAAIDRETRDKQNSSSLLVLGCSFSFSNIFAALVGYASASMSFRYFGISGNPLFSFGRHAEVGYPVVFSVILCSVPLIVPAFFSNNMRKTVYALALLPFLVHYSKAMMTLSELPYGVVLLITYIIFALLMLIVMDLKLRAKLCAFLSFFLLLSSLFILGNTYFRNAFGVLEHNGNTYAISHD